MEEIDIKALFKILNDKKFLIIVFAIIGGLIGYIYNKEFVKPMYESRSSIILSATDGSIEGVTDEITQTDITINEKLVNTYAEIAKSDSVLDKVIAKLNLKTTSKKLAKNITVNTEAKTTVIKLVVKAEDPDQAVNISNELISVFFERVGELYNIKTAKVLDAPKINKTSVNVNPTKFLIIGAVIGAAIAIFLALFMDVFNDNLKTESDIEDKVKLHVLTKVPKFSSKNMIVSFNERSYEAEAFRTLVANIKYFDKKTILVTSNTPDEGKSTVSINLALTLANSGKRTLLIDCDLRKGTQHLLLNIPNKYGLSNLVREDSADYKSVLNESVIENLDVITKGSAVINYSKLLFSTTIGRIVDDAKTKYDYIIIDGTPSELVSDDSILYKSVDATAIVVKYNNTKASQVNKIKATIKRSGGSVIGVIINGIPKDKLGNKRYGYYEESSYIVERKPRRH